MATPEELPQAEQTTTTEEPSPSGWADEIEAMCARLRASRASVIDDLFAIVPPERRAAVAMHCFRRDNLKETAYVIAQTCDRRDLHKAGDGMGEVLYTLSRKSGGQP